jgi:TLC domain
MRLGGMSAIVGLVSQWVFTRFFQKFDKDGAAFTSHSLVALIFMILLSVVGGIGWWNHGIFPSTPIDRLLVPNDQCRWLATIVTGMLTFWDLPTSLSIPRLRKPDVLAHHMIMSVTAFVAAVYLPMFYVFFYMGVSEISSIPLIIYDQLSVWTSNTNSLSSTVPNNGNEPDDGATEKPQSVLILTRTVFQVLAAVCFTMIRAVAFTYITLRHFIPDVLHVLAQSPSRTPVVTALRFALGASIGFTALQLYWFWLMVKTILGRSPK